MDWIGTAWSVFEKDVRLEWRTKFGINMLIMFALTALFLVVYATGNEPSSAKMRASLLWIVVIFAAAIGMSRAFLSEEEQGTGMLLRLHAPASAIYTGKLLFNFVLLAAVTVIALAAFVVLLNATPSLPSLLVVTAIGGSFALASATTLLSAVIARVRGGAGLLPLLLFPLLLPLLGAVVGASAVALTPGQSWSAANEHLLTIVAFAGVTLGASLLLFEYVWNE